MKYRLMILAATALSIAAGCGDRDSNDSPPIVDPAPTPAPEPGQPIPEPEPEPAPPPPEPPGWFEQMDSTGWFEAVSAVDAQHAWACGGSDLFRTVNGGATWAWVGRTPATFGS